MEPDVTASDLKGSNGSSVQATVQRRVIKNRLHRDLPTVLDFGEATFPFLDDTMEKLQVSQLATAEGWLTIVYEWPAAQ